MSRAKNDKTWIEPETGTIYITDTERYDYHVKKGRNNYYTLFLSHRIEEQHPNYGKWHTNFTWEFSIQDFRMAFKFIPSKAQYPLNRVDGIIDKLIEFYISQHILVENDSAIPVVKLFFKKFYDSWVLGDAMDSDQNYLNTWDEELNEEQED